MATTDRRITKKLINLPERCVGENLEGLVALYPGLRLHPTFSVVTLQAKEDSRRVAILGGGGSGHEPFATGMVGHGMLHGGVAGGVFASPPTDHVHYAITHLYKYNSGGVIVVIGNYTGDKLNFGAAIDRARKTGVKVKSLIVGEDVATKNNKLGGRGMCGEIVLYKLLGAMSAEGRSFQDIHSHAELITKHLATLGVCLTACSLPGQPPLFEILPDEMELGAGVHGEAGIKRMKLGSASEVVGIVLDEVVEHLKLDAGTRVAALINNLGGTSILEMNILGRETKKYLDKKNIKAERIYSGPLKSSLEMHGFQICLLHLSSEHGDYWLKLLDAATDAPGWPGTSLSSAGDGVNIADDVEILKSINTARPSGPTLSAEHTNLIRKCLAAAAEALIENEKLLNRLDSGCGDGDCGNTLTKLANGLKEYIKVDSNFQSACPTAVLQTISDVAKHDMGGTSGGFYSLGLSAAAEYFSSAEDIGAARWWAAWDTANEAIKKHGGAEQGDRTMLDTLCPAADTFKRCLQEDLDWKTTLEKTMTAVEDGAKSTSSMIAVAGRASYVSKEHVRDEDAGARAVALWMNAILAILSQQ